MTDWVGKQIGKYKVTELLGQGGMGEVYKAYHPALERDVAIKLIHTHLTTDPEAIERFRREAKVVAALRHPGIVQIYDFDVEDEAFYMVMEFVSGQSLKQRLMPLQKQSQPLSLEEALALFLPITEAVAYAHGQGVIHRDLKPANVLLTNEGQPILADFGLSKILSSQHLTATGLIFGTPQYMAPEQASGQETDARTDIYALGVILFEMLTGQIPHDAETPFGTILKRATQPVQFPRSLNSQIPESVEQVILKALAREPEDRFHSAEALATALKTATETVSPISEEQPTILSPKKAILSPEKDKVAVPVKPEVNLGRRIANLLTNGQDVDRNQRNRLAMLKLVYDFWVRGVLESSLHGMTLIELGLEARPEAVEHPWEMVLQTPNLPQLIIPLGTRLVDVFDEMGHSLLILGEPGSGKTTMLLELTRDLIARSEQDPTQPIPAVFNLSAWAESQPPLAEWLVDELRAKYNIPKKIAQPWVENDELLLLLDGLDEVSPGQREACVQALNEFRQEHFVPMVVCSRIAEYEMLTSHLKLHGAVLLQPLTPEQVDTYLAEAGPELAGVLAMVKNDPTLQELSQSTLMLSIMIQAYTGLSAEETVSFDSVEDRRQHLFDIYVRRMFARRGVDQRYSPQHTVSWLSWLAQQMAQHNQTIFLIKRMQPSWLPTRLWPRIYRSANNLGGGLLIGLPIGLLLPLFGLFVETEVILSPRDVLINWLRGGTTIGLIIAVIVGVILWLRGRSQELTNDIQTVEALHWSWRRAGIAGLVILLIVGLFTVVYPGSCLFVGLLFGLIVAIIYVLRHDTIETKTAPNQGIHLSAQNAIFGGLIVCLIAGLSLTLVFLSTFFAWDFLNGKFSVWQVLWGNLGLGLMFGVIFGLIGVSWYGGLTLIKHYTLRLILWYKGYTPRNYAHFLDYASGRIFLRKVGGGYIFIHRLLMEHFASMQPETMPDRKTHGVMPAVVVSTILLVGAVCSISYIYLLTARLTADDYVQSGRSHVEAGNLEQAVEDFIIATELGPDYVFAWRHLCWYGSLAGKIIEVLDACDRALELNPDDYTFLDSRGLAHALTGDYEGAIEDFEAVVELSKRGIGDPYPPSRDRRQGWITELKAGRNPFDEATLKSLCRGCPQ